MNASKNDTENLKEEPLRYWEEAYMMVILEEVNKELLQNIIERVSKIEGVKIKENQPLTEKEVGRIKLNYENEWLELWMKALKKWYHHHGQR